MGNGPQDMFCHTLDHEVCEIEAQLRSVINSDKDN